MAAIGVLLVAPPAIARQNPIPDEGARPLSIILPNYNSVAVGEIGSLEANAFLARADDSAAPWYNPAGLTLAKQSSVSGTAGMFQFTEVTPEGLEQRGRSFQQVPSLVSFVAADPFGHAEWALGLAVARVHAWSQSLAAERTFPAVGGSERIMVSSLSSLSGWMANLGAGHALTGRSRIGASLDVQLTMAERDESLSDHHLSGAGLAATLIDSQGSATTVHFRASVGLQYDVRPTFRIGALVRTPGLRAYQSGSYFYEGLARTGAATTTRSLFADGDVQYRLPFEFKVGAAYTGERARLEVDLLTWAGAGTYEAFTTDSAVTITTDPGTGAAPSVRTVAYTPQVVDARAVVNVAVGGQVHLTPGGSWMLHGGYATDRSPVGPADTYFTKVPMQVITAGVSGRASFILGSVGLRYQAGSSDHVPLRQLQDGQQLTTRLRVSSFGLVYSVSLRF